MFILLDITPPMREYTVHIEWTNTRTFKTLLPNLINFRLNTKMITISTSNWKVDETHFTQKSLLFSIVFVKLIFFILFSYFIFISKLELEIIHSNYARKKDRKKNIFFFFFLSFDPKEKKNFLVLNFF